MIIPEGSHDVEFRFEPASVQQSQTVAFVSSLIFILLILTVIGLEVRTTMRETPVEEE
jgi:hypothetical protein